MMNMNKSIFVIAFLFASSISFAQSSASNEIKGILDAHNKYRKAVGVKPLKWSHELAAYARAWGENLLKNGCKLEHRPYRGKWKQEYGENLYWTSGNRPTPWEAADSWGEEKKRLRWRGDEQKKLCSRSLHTNDLGKNHTCWLRYCSM